VGIKALADNGEGELDPESQSISAITKLKLTFPRPRQRSDLNPFQYAQLAKTVWNNEWNIFVQFIT
jgi:hypothetical protein